MDGIIVLAIIAIVFFASGSSKKKKAQKQGGAKPPYAPPEPEIEEKKPNQQSKIPFTKAEWVEYLKNEAGVELPHPGGVQKARPKDIQAARPKPAAPSLRQPVPSAPRPKAVSVKGGEGTVSTQGESEQEHAAHRRRILAEEAEDARRRQELSDLKQLNLEKLRTAVVMSEVLGKPVSLRPRGRRW